MLQAYSVRLTLIGETEFQRQLNNLIDEQMDSFRFDLSGTQVFVEKISDNTEPSVDLEELAEGSSPVARLAELVLGLKEDPESLPDELLEKVKSGLDEIYGKHYYEPLRIHGDLEKPDRGRIADIIRQQGYLLIKELISQKENPS